MSFQDKTIESTQIAKMLQRFYYIKIRNRRYYSVKNEDESQEDKGEGLSKSGFAAGLVGIARLVASPGFADPSVLLFMLELIESS